MAAGIVVFIGHIERTAISSREDSIPEYTMGVKPGQKIIYSTTPPNNVHMHQNILKNRRCEFLAWEIDTTKTTSVEKDQEIYLGHLRGTFSGHISAWAGANINLNAGLAVACPKGILTVKGSPKEEVSDGKVNADSFKAAQENLASAGAQAFAGVKVEAGLKAILDWKPPQTKPESGQQSVTELTKPSSFAPLGSVGYTLTGLIGIGAKADFKIGFDQISHKFVVKVNAETALGLGVGGQLDIVVGIGQCWDFIALIHDQLKRNNFNFVDIFETEEDESGLNVFDLYNVWNFKLIVSGNPLIASAVLAVKGASEVAFQLLDLAFDILKEWEDDRIINQQMDTLIETLRDCPDHIRYLTPETKGRMLYELIAVDGDFEENLENLWAWDINKRREDAAMALLKNGIHSQTDWLETLEHLGERKGEGYTPIITKGASIPDKVQRAKDNEQYLRNNLLNDTVKWDDLQQFISTLPHSINQPESK